MKTAILVTTYNRADALFRSLSQITQLGPPVLVVDDGSQCCQTNAELCRRLGAAYLFLPSNRGLAAALNAGLAYWLADHAVDFIGYFQDDVDVHPRCLDILQRVLMNHDTRTLYTGHDAPEHPGIPFFVQKTPCLLKDSCRATHMHGHRTVWERVLPFPTVELGCPKRRSIRTGKPMGSNVDWWITRDAPQSTFRRRQKVVCVPGLVRTFLHRASESCWSNEQRSGEDRPLGVY